VLRRNMAECCKFVSHLTTLDPRMESALSFPFSDLPALGQTLPVAPGVDWLRMPLPFALDHINLWLLADGEGVAAVDTGFCLPQVKEAWKSALVGRRLQGIIVTHGHPDHLGLAAWLMQAHGVSVTMTQGEYMAAKLIIEQAPDYDVESMLAFFAAHGLDTVRLDGLRRRGNGFKLGVPELPSQFRRLFADDVLAIGGHDWRVIIGHGHSPEHAALYCATLGVLISGDMLLPRITTNVPVLSMCPDDDPLARFLGSIDRFLVLPPDTLVLPSHGRPFRGIHERVRQLHAHHAARCELLLAHCETPKSAAELIPVLFEREIPDPHQVMFAMGEAIAHLNHLLHSGRLTRVSTDGIHRYRCH
jgi:glyoxylase-like metal-dependent hydrolase (beta-lactamase superfamily II)